MTHEIPICFGLTGGIATGKSTALRFFRELQPGLEIFDSDGCVSILLESARILSKIEVGLGGGVLNDEGALDREVLRNIIFRDPAKREILEGILHPEVRKECLEKVAKWHKQQGRTMFVADVPLLFEGGFDFGQEFNLVVATSEETQRTRLKARSQFDDAMISSILAAQLPIREKVDRADVVFWNEGPLSCLHAQVEQFTNDLS
ncbi:MAG: dephospho-CoA kinase [Verrucomicrobiaceae bacterium]